MAGVLTHDLLGYLNTMALNLELLQHAANRESIDAATAARIRGYAAIVAAEIPELTRMIRAVTAQMRLSDPPTARFEFRSLCEELALVLAAMAGSKKHLFRTTLADLPMMVVGDRDAVAHAVTTLLFGALQVLPQGSAVTLSLQADRRQAVLSMTAQPNMAGVPGVAAKDATEAFADARAVLEQHGVRVTQNPEAPGPEGSTALELTFPLVSLSS